MKLLLRSIALATMLFTTHAAIADVIKHPTHECISNGTLTINGRIIVKDCGSIAYAKGDSLDQGVFLVRKEHVESTSSVKTGLVEHDYFTSAYSIDGEPLIKKPKGFDYIINRIGDKRGHNWFVIAKKLKKAKKKPTYGYGLADDRGNIIVPPVAMKPYWMSVGGKIEFQASIEFPRDGLIIVWRTIDEKGDIDYHEIQLYDYSGNRLFADKILSDQFWIFGNALIAKIQSWNHRVTYGPYLFDMNSGKLAMTDNGNDLEVGGFKKADNGDIWITSGNNRMLLDTISVTLGPSEVYRKRIGRNLYRIKVGDLFGIENDFGSVIVKPEHARIERRGDEVGNGENHRKSYSGCVLVASHPTLGGRRTGYGFFEEYKAVFNTNGEMVIPYSRGYNELTPYIEKVERKPGSYRPAKPLLWYNFAITTGGIEVIGICDVHGREIWRSQKPGDMESGIDYDRYSGFFYRNNVGQLTYLGIYLSDDDYSWDTEIAPENPDLAIERTMASTPKKWTESADGLFRCHHKEPDGFEWVEVKDGSHEYAEDPWGNVLVGKGHGSSGFVSYRANSYVRGMFFRTTLGMGFFCCEVFTREGNPVIDASRNYQSVRLDHDSKCLITQVDKYIGACDFNGYEVAKPKYKSFDYDGYTFDGELPDGRTERYKVHERPARTERRVRRNTGKKGNRRGNNGDGWYYESTPWLWTPAPGYTPTFTMDWSTPVYMDSEPMVSGGSSDYTSGSGTSATGASSTSSHAKDCPYCNGTGKRLYDSYSASSFGLDTDKKRCSECGSWYPANQTHSHVTCGHCGGTGKIR